MEPSDRDRARTVADNRHGYGTKPACEQLVVRVEIQFDVSDKKRHSGV